MLNEDTIFFCAGVRSFAFAHSNMNEIFIWYTQVHTSDYDEKPLKIETAI